MLEAYSLRKSYGNVVAVDGVSLRAAEGETVGLLGPNGAGKTTTVSMIAGLVRPDSGSVKIEGRPFEGDTDPNKRRIGLVPQDLALFDELPARENLLLFAALYDLSGPAANKAIGEALERVAACCLDVAGAAHFEKPALVTTEAQIYSGILTADVPAWGSDFRGVRRALWSLIHSHREAYAAFRGTAAGYGYCLSADRSTTDSSKGNRHRRRSK